MMKHMKNHEVKKKKNEEKTVDEPIGVTSMVKKNVKTSVDSTCTAPIVTTSSSNYPVLTKFRPQINKCVIKNENSSKNNEDPLYKNQIPSLVNSTIDVSPSTSTTKHPVRVNSAIDTLPSTSTTKQLVQVKDEDKTDSKVNLKVSKKDTVKMCPIFAKQCSNSEMSKSDLEDARLKKKASIMKKAKKYNIKRSKAVEPAPSNSIKNYFSPGRYKSE